MPFVRNNPNLVIQGIYRKSYPQKLVNYFQLTFLLYTALKIVKKDIKLCD